jgi:glycosyltransferase involved in cell wall biosynthesis
MKDTLSIVIPSKNEGKGLIDVLKLLRKQTDCKIIIADSSNDKASTLLLNKYKSIYSDIIVVDGGLPAFARNRGAKFVTTPYVLFLDADVYIEKRNIIKKSLEKAIKEDYDLVTCKFKTDKPYRWVYRVFDIIQWLTSFNKPFALGGFMLFKMETFKKLGGFNEEDKIAEDYHLSSKIQPKKFKVINKYVYTPARRFKNKGVFFMFKLMLNCWFNRNNENFYKKSHNYWI